MAITINKYPDTFSLSGNPNIYIISSSQPNLLGININITPVASNEVLGSFLFTPTPDNPNTIYFNLAKILDNYVTYDFKKYDNGIEVFNSESGSLFRYELKMYEKFLSGSSVVTSSITTSNSRYVLKGELDKIGNLNWNSSDHKLPTGSQPLKFLTSKPNYSSIYPESEDGLYFLNQQIFGTVRAKVNFKNKQNTINSSISMSVSLIDGNLFRINTSPEYYFINHGIDYLSSDIMEVYLEDGSSNILSEVKTYIIKSSPCNTIPINIYFTNEYGVFDSFLFHYAEPILTVNREVLSRNPYKVINGNLTNYNNQHFFADKEIINRTFETTLRLTTRDLTDKESIWLSRLLLSKQLFIKIGDYYLPTIIGNNSYSIPKKRSVQGLNIKEFDFKLSDNYLYTGVGFENNNINESLYYILTEYGFNILLENAP